MNITSNKRAVKIVDGALLGVEDPSKVGTVEAQGDTGRHNKGPLDLTVHRDQLHTIVHLLFSGVIMVVKLPSKGGMGEMGRGEDVVKEGMDQASTVNVPKALALRSMILSQQDVSLAITPPNNSQSQEKKGARDGEVRIGRGEGLGREAQDLGHGVEDPDLDQGPGEEDQDLGPEGGGPGRENVAEVVTISTVYSQNCLVLARVGSKGNVNLPKSRRKFRKKSQSHLMKSRGRSALG